MKNLGTKLLCLLFFDLLWVTGLCQSIIVQYQYDDLHRLTTETYSSGLLVQYTYDILGNRTTKITSGNPCAVPSTSFTSATNNLVVTFTNTTVNGTTYNWAFGNGQTSTLSNPIVTYATAGTYQVCLTATNGCGSQQFCQQVTVTNCVLPTAGFTRTTNFLSATFANTSTGATSYLWNFGNGQTSTQANPSHTYASAGTYNVCLTATNACGSNQTCQQVTVANCSLPTSGFSHVSNNLQVTFSNSSTGATSYVWNFGNGQTSTLASPSVTYAAAGTYNVCLTATNGCGLQQFCQQVTVVSCASSVNAGADQSMCFGGTGTIIGSANISGYSYSWSPTTGLSAPAASSTSASPTATTLYTLTASQPGCASLTDQVLVTVGAPARIYVNKNVVGGNGTGNSWTNAIPELGEALWAAHSSACNTEIWVATGTYLPTRDPAGAINPADPRMKNFYLKNGIGIYGGFAGTETSILQRNLSANTATLSGDIGVVNDSTDNSYSVLLSIYDNANTIVDGFTITKGHANTSVNVNVEGVSVENWDGGGIYNHGSMVVVRNCTFFRNYYSRFGGGVYNLAGSPHFENCKFLENKGSPIMAWSTPFGGGMSSRSSSCTIEDCEFQQNQGGYGGGMYFLLGSPTLLNTRISSNIALNGGGISNNSSNMVVKNCVFDGNQSTAYGGGINNYSTVSPGTAEITNCTFVNNYGANAGGGIVNNTNYTTTVSNCILWGNTTSLNNAGGNSTINYSIVQGGYVGTNNSSTDPIFVNSADPDGPDNIWRTSDDGLMIAPCSPALDAGNSALAPTTDILGNPRYDVPSVGISLVDLGAYERQNGQLQIPAITGAPSFCQGSNTTLTASGGTSYLWSTGATTPTLTVSQAGSYTVTVTSAGGCAATATQTVTLNTSPTPAVSGPTSVCNGTIATLAASGGTNYLWSNGATTPSISVGVAGNYSVTVTNANGCSASTTHTLTTNASPIASIAGPNSFCSGSNAILNASGGVTYQWNTGATTPSITAIAPGTYVVTVSNASGCAAIASQTVAANTPPTISISGPTVICAGSTAILSATGGASYLWSTGATSPNISASNTGSYTVTVTGSNGCTATSTANLLANPLPIASINGNLSICQGGTTMLTASGGTNYAWSTGATSPTIITGTAGSYSVTVTDANGCYASASETVLVNAVPTATITGSPFICNGSSTTLTASGGIFYLWNTGTTLPTITPTTPGTYTVTVSNANGCSVVTSSTVTLNSLPNATISGTSSVCNGDNAFLSASGGNYYTWSNGSTASSVTVNVAGTYTVTVTDVNGCSDTASQTLIVNPLPNAAIGGPNQVCSASSVTLSGYGGSMYLWSNGSTAANIIVNAPGTYTVSATNSFGCFASASHTLIAAQSPIASISGNLGYCNGGGTTITAVGGASYLWNTGSTNATALITAPGTYAVTVTAINGCSDTTSVAVTENPSPIAVISGDSAICDGETSTLVASGGIVYSWSNGASTASTTILAAGTYTVTVTDANGCVDTGSVFVVVNPNPPSPTITVLGNTLASSNANAYQWFFAGNSIPGATGQFYQATQTGFYSVLVTANGCSTMSQPFPHTFIVAVGDSINLGVKVFPNPNQGEFVVEFGAPTSGLLRLKVTNVLGQEIYGAMVEPNTSKINVILDAVSDGVYLLEIWNSENNQRSVFNLLIKR